MSRAGPAGAEGGGGGLALTPLSGAVRPGLAALHEAVLSGNLECVKLLVRYGADVHQRDDTGWTPLHIACSDGYPDIAR